MRTELAVDLRILGPWGKINVGYTNTSFFVIAKHILYCDTAAVSKDLNT